MSTSYGWDLHGFVRNKDINQASYLLLYIVILLFISSLTYKIGKIWKLYWLPEVGVTIAVGALTGCIVYQSKHSDALSTFSTELFFSYLLPIIIFSSGFQISLTQFSSYYTEIITLAVLGTLISVIVIGFLLYLCGRFNIITSLSLMECLSFGSIISATDPVSTLAIFAEFNVQSSLYMIVLGSSILDDAIAVILLNTFNGFINTSFDALYALLTISSFFVVNLVGSTLLGMLIGLVMVYMLKIDRSLRSRKIMLVITCLATIYISYLTAYVFQISAIISTLYAAMVFKKYLGKFLPAEDIVFLKSFIDIISGIAENLVFFSIGMSLYDPKRQSAYDAGFIAVTAVLCVFGRAAFVYPLTYLLNLRCYGQLNKSRLQVSCRESDGLELLSRTGLGLDPINNSDHGSHDSQHRPDTVEFIDLNTQHMIVFAGLRGPISYGSSLLFSDALKHRDLIVATTRAIMLLTIYIKGGLTANALKFFHITQNVQEDDFCGTRSPVVSSSDTTTVAAAAASTQAVLIKQSGGDLDGFAKSLSWIEQVELNYILPLFESQDPPTDNVASAVPYRRRMRARAGAYDPVEVTHSSMSSMYNELKSWTRRVEKVRVDEEEGGGQESTYE
jgi:NhaP-type Na+/H+ or K+/H+ antiporter